MSGEKSMSPPLPPPLLPSPPSSNAEA